MVVRFLLTGLLALVLLTATVASVSATPGSAMEFIEKIVPLSWNPMDVTNRDHRALCAIYAAKNFKMYIALSPHPDRANENVAFRLLSDSCLLMRY